MRNGLAPSSSRRSAISSKARAMSALCTDGVGLMQLAAPHPHPALLAVQELVAAQHVVADAVGDVVEIARAAFQLEIEGGIVEILLVENGRGVALGVGRADLGNLAGHGSFLHMGWTMLGRAGA